jgi:RNA polymerase sigma-70 factor (ECF subfamily)
VQLELGPPGSDAERLVFERYGGKLVRYFQKRGLSLEDAEDLTQETLIRVLKAEAQLPSRSELEAWLFEIAKNVDLNRVRERSTLKRSAIVVSLDEPAASGDDAQNRTPRREPETEEPDALAQLLENEQLERLAAAFDELPPQMRQCVRLRVDQDRKIEEIATLLRISPNTVKSHLHHAKPRLRARLEDLFGPFDL